MEDCRSWLTKYTSKRLMVVSSTPMRSATAATTGTFGFRSGTDEDEDEEEDFNDEDFEDAAQE
jgi:hypothetical protein